jgi:hypothetical protein
VTASARLGASKAALRDARRVAVTKVLAMDRRETVAAAYRSQHCESSIELES